MGSHKRRREGFAGQRLVRLPPAIIKQSARMPVVRDLYVTDIGHFPRAVGHYVNRSKGVKQFILIYCVAGGGWCRFAGNKWPVPPGSVIVIPPNESHSYGADPAGPWSIYWVHFAGRSSADYQRMLGVNAAGPVIHVSREDQLIEAFEQMYDHVRYGYTPATLAGLSTHLGRFIGLLNTHHRPPGGLAHRAADPIRRSICFMNEHLRQRVDLPALAKAAGLSVTHYSALFRRHTGSSPMEFFIRLKIQRACELLDTTGADVQDVGRQIGYDDPYYFSRLFKKVMGRPPTDYRKMPRG